MPKEVAAQIKYSFASVHHDLSTEVIVESSLLTISRAEAERRGLLN